MRELFVDTQEAVGEDGHTHHFRYYILVDQMEVGRQFACESYGVKVAEQGGETACLPNLTINVGRIDSLMEMLTRNQVGPAGLRDVVDDWL